MGMFGDGGYLDTLVEEAKAYKAANGPQAQFNKIGDDVYQKQLGGLQGALASYGGTKDALYDMKKGMTTPYEDAWTQRSGDYNYANKNTASLYGDLSKQYSGKSPTQLYAESGINNLNASYEGGNQLRTARGALAGNGYSGDQYENNRAQFAGPGQAEQFYSGQAQAMNRPGAAEQFYQNSASRYQQPTALQGAYADQQNYYRASGATADAAGQRAVDARSEQLKLADAIHGAQNELGSQGGTAKYEGEVGAGFRDANDLQQFRDRQGQNFEQQGQFEDFAQGLQNGGDNAYLDREREKGNAALNQQMAARGHFNSGGAMTALGNYNAELDAQKFKYAGDMLNQAQQSQMARLGQGASLAHNVSGEKVQTAQGLQGLGGQLSQEQIGRHNALSSDAFGIAGISQADRAQGLQAAQMQDQDALARRQLQGKMAGDVSASNLSYLQGEQGAASDAQSQNLARMMGMGSLANTAQSQAQNRGQMMFNQAQGLDAQTLARQKSLYDMANSNDASSLARTMGGYTMTRGGDDVDIAQNGQLIGMASDQDDRYLQSLNDYFKQAGGVQGMNMERLKTLFGAQFGLDQAQAGLYPSMFNPAVSMYGDARSAGLNAEFDADEAERARDERNSLWNKGMELGGLGLKYAGLPK